MNRTPKRCIYEEPGSGYHCPHDAVEGRDHCIFHLPVEEKPPGKFWKHLAGYLAALYETAGNSDTKTFASSGDAWVFSPDRQAERDHYKKLVKEGQVWDFRGFVFPDMHEKVILKHDEPDEWHEDPEGSIKKYEETVESRDFKDFVFGALDFSHAIFMQDAVFEGATFSKTADFHGSAFRQKADFRDTLFKGPADFSEAEFARRANFSMAAFSRKAEFRRAQFADDVNLHRAQISGPFCLSGVRFHKLVDLSYVTLRNRLLFEGTDIGSESLVLLWHVNFEHGISDVHMEEGHRTGQIEAPRGQVVFQDIGHGINRISLLHTDVYSEHLHVRFSNVVWNTNPKRFIFDARFVFNLVSDWMAETGLSKNILDQLPGLFNARREVPESETETQRAERKKRESSECERLVKQDVERIAREIRRSYEDYGNYPDAGDYYIAEMDYRRERTPRYSFRRLALWLYKQISNYGESPGRALMSLLFVHLASTMGYLLTGFYQGKHPVKPLFASGWPYIGTPLMDFCRSLLCSVFNLVPGYFRGQSLSFTANPVLATTEALLGVAVLTLFLLAVRRRFRR